MKKPWKRLPAAVATALAGALWFHTDAASAVAECNRESTFLLDLALPETAFTGTQSMEHIDGCGGYTLRQNGVSYRVSGYPDVQDAYHVTDIIIDSDLCAVYGIHVGDSLEDGEGKLIRWGYVREASPDYLRVYRKHDVTIALAADEPGNICCIRVEVDVTNKETVLF